MKLKNLSKDERISGLVNSNNQLREQLEHASNLRIDTTKMLITKIKNQKLAYEKTFKGNQYLIAEFQTDINFIEEIRLPPATEVETQEQ